MPLNAFLSLLLLFCSICLGISPVNSQTITVGAGLLPEDLNSYNKEDGNERSRFTARGGFALHAGISEMANDSFLVDFSIRFIQYEGEFFEGSGGLGGETTTRGDLFKQVMGLGVYPLNTELFNALDLSLGGLINILLSEKVSGSHHYWDMSGTNSTTEFNSAHTTISERLYFGLIGQISYDFKLTEHWFVAPQYIFYWGWTEEFIDITGPRRLRHMLSLQVKMEL